MANQANFVHPMMNSGLYPSNHANNLYPNGTDSRGHSMGSNNNGSSSNDDFMSEAPKK